MTFFKLVSTKNENAGFNPIEEGRYEAVVTEAEVGKTMNGGDKITVTFKIRDDVNQKYKNYEIKFNTFTFANEIALKIVGQLVESCGFEDGHEFKSPQDMANQLINKPVQIVVKHEKYTKDGEEKIAPKAKFFNKTKFPSKSVAPTATIIQEDELPF